MAVKKEVTFQFWLSKEQRDQIRKVATLAGMNDSTWVRSVLVKAAQRILRKNT